MPSAKSWLMNMRLIHSAGCCASCSTRAAAGASEVSEANGANDASTTSGEPVMFAKAIMFAKIVTSERILRNRVKSGGFSGFKI